MPGVRGVVVRGSVLHEVPVPRGSEPRGSQAAPAPRRPMVSCETVTQRKCCLVSCVSVSSSGTTLAQAVQRLVLHHVGREAVVLVHLGGRGVVSECGLC